MTSRLSYLVVLAAAAVMVVSGCAAPQIDFSALQQPARAAELAAYDVFVGKWIWEADVANAEGADKHWTGDAKWEWTLDDRCLHGVLSAKGAHAEFKAAGVWSWHPKDNKYIWWMFNNWGYPQQGTAKYDEATKTWTMPYQSVGLDGTTSHGCFTMKTVDNDTLDWSMVEWADMLHMVKKLEMTGTYKRQK